MKYLKFIAGAMLLSMSACSDNDEPAGGNTGGGTADNTAGFYSTISISMPPSSRASRADNKFVGEEVGQDVENKVGSILVVVAKEDATVEGGYKFVTFALNDAPITGTNNNTHTIVFQDKEALFNEAGNDVCIFAYCNPTDEIRTKIAGTINAATGKYEGGLSTDDAFTEEICTAGADTWRDNAFLMTSVAVHKVQLGDEATLKTYNTPGNPFPLGKVKVIRTASRFDFRDASVDLDEYKDLPEGETAPALTYPVYDPNLTPKKKVADITLSSVALFNLADKFYYLPHSLMNGTGNPVVSAGPDDNATHFMTALEFPNLVVSPASQSYSYGIPQVSGVPTINPLDRAAAGLDWKDLAELIGGTEDKDNDWNTGEGAQDNRKGYHIWRYATENTFAKGYTPAVTEMTGLVFEAEIKPATDFGNVVDGAYSDMYLYGGILYANTKQIYEAAQLSPSTNLANAFNAGFDVTLDESGAFVSATPKEGVDLANLKFTVYKPDPNRGNKYFCYYFYFNQHDADNDPTMVSDMEYATVRNNVYKIAVKKITGFGTFTPPDPKDWDVYFQVDVEVLNWVVRVNDGIEF